jgi:5-hydroxyisourate hydrolase
MTISTHVLDAVSGGPAPGMELRLERVEGTQAAAVGRGATNADGRCPELTDGLRLEVGTYRLRFETGEYFARTDTPTFYPVVVLTFEVTDAAAHYHVPLLLSPFSYSTYRGS